MYQSVLNIKSWLATLVTALTFAMTSNVVMAAVEKIHIEIVSAPVVANGLVASEPTEFNLILRRDGVPAESALDPEVFGLQIPAGGHMDVKLSGSFMPNPYLDGFFRGRNVILTTGPQNPVKPNTEVVSGGNWSATLSNPNTVTVTPNAGSGDNGLEGTRAEAIGFKVIHIRPDTGNRSFTGTPYYNGPAGSVGKVTVNIYDAGNRLKASGKGSIVFPASVGPQAFITNGGTRDDLSDNSNTNFQRVSAGTTLDGTSIPSGGSFADGAPYAPQFLLFADFGSHPKLQFPKGPNQPGADSYIPFDGFVGLTVAPSADPTVAYLIQNGTQIGTAMMTGPATDNSFMILADMASVVPTGNGTRLFLPVQVGDTPGIYQVTVQLNGGGSATNTIIVE